MILSVESYFQTLNYNLNRQAIMLKVSLPLASVQLNYTAYNRNRLSYNAAV